MEATVAETSLQVAVDLYPLLCASTDYFLGSFDTRAAALVAAHPLSRQLERLIVGHEQLGGLFQVHGDGASDRPLAFGGVVTNAGIGFPLDSRTVGASIICHAAARHRSLDSLERFSDEVARSLELAVQLSTGKPTPTPCRVGFTNIVIVEDDLTVDLAVGALRSSRPVDDSAAPLERGAVEHRVDDAAVRVHERGDVILDATVDISLKRAKKGDPPDQRFMSESEEGIDRLALHAGLAIVLGSTDAPPAAPLRTWHTVDLPLSDMRTVGWRSRARGRRTALTVLDTRAAESITTWSHRVASRDSSKVEVAIRRLQRALTERDDPVDRLIDAIIGWENLFGSRQGEVTLRVTSSLAWLLANTATERRRLLSELKGLYGRRSSVVHGSEDSSPSAVHDQADRATEILIRALRGLFEDDSGLLELDSAERSARLMMG